MAYTLANLQDDIRNYTEVDSDVLSTGVLTVPDMLIKTSLANAVCIISIKNCRNSCKSCCSELLP